MKFNYVKTILESNRKRLEDEIERTERRIMEQRNFLNNSECDLAELNKNLMEINQVLKGEFK
jgi:septal ring factor EnvC (AmiA/AmiB activator)